MRLEYTAEIKLVRIPHILADGENIEIRVDQQLFGAVNPELGDKFNGGDILFFFKDFADIVRGETEGVGDML